MGNSNINQNPSFALNSLMRLYSSDIFCPIDYKLKEIDDKGSLHESLQASQLNDLFEQRCTGIRLSYSKKLLSAAGRAAAIYAIGVFSVAGVLFNTVRLVLLHTDRSLNQTKFLDKKIVLKKAILADLTCFTVSTISLSIFFGFPIGASAIILTYKCFFNHISSLQLVTTPEERPAYIKAIRLRTNFGIVGKNGQILTPNASKDGEDFLTNHEGNLTRMCKAKATAFLEEIEKLQRLLGPQYRLRSPLNGIPRASTIIAELSSKLSYLPVEIGGRIPFSSIKETLTSFEAQYKELWDILIECAIQRRSVFISKDADLGPGLGYIFTKAEVERYFSLNLRSYTPWESYILGSSNKLEEYHSRSEEASKILKVLEPPIRYLMFRNLIPDNEKLSRDPSAKFPKEVEFLRVYDETLKESEIPQKIKKIYRTACTEIHPDKMTRRIGVYREENKIDKKNPTHEKINKILNGIEDEANELFKVLNHLNELYQKK